MRISVFVFFIIISNICLGQLDSIHYLPPLHSRNDGSIEDHYIYLSTPETKPFQVNVTDGSGQHISGSPFTLSNALPLQILIGNGQLNGSKLMVKKSELNTVLNNRGLILTADKKFYANARYRQSNVQAGSLTCKGKASMGRVFRIGYTPFVNENTYPCRAFVVGFIASEDSTSIKISNYNSNVIFHGATNITDDTLNLMLNKGNTYVLSGYTNVSANLKGFIGALVESNHPIIISSGSWLGSISSSSGLQDICIDQIVPVEELGQTYISVMAEGSSAQERPMILAHFDDTKIFINGSSNPITTINAGEYFLVNNSYYKGNAHKNMLIETTQPAYVYQFMAGSTSEATPGMNFLPPIQCGLPKFVDLIPQVSKIGPQSFTGGLYIISEKSGNVELNNTLLSSPETVTGSNKWETYKVKGITGNVKIESDRSIAVGFFGVNNAAGFGGYYSGFSRSFTPKFEIKDSICLGESFDIEFTGDSIYGADVDWDFGSSDVVYNLSDEYNPSDINYIDSGFYTINLSLTHQGCSSEYAKSIMVLPVPNAHIYGDTLVCQNDKHNRVIFKGENGRLPYTFKYTINGGITQNILSNNDTISIAQTHQSSGDFNYHLIQVDDANAPYCSQVLDETVNINVLPKPNASIGNSEVVCQNDTDPEIIIMGYDGESPYTFYYRINDGQTQTNESSLNNSYILHQSTSIPGSFEYILDSIVDAGILGCTNLINDTVLIKINPLPQAELYGDTSICQNDSPVEVSFKGLDGVLPYTFNYEINGENSGVISTSSTDSLIEIVHNTDSSGVFTYNLISVSDGNSPSCEQLLNEQIVVEVNEIPEAIMLGSTKICQNTQSPRVLFKGNQGIEPYKFEYTINGGSIQTIQTSFNDTVSIPQPTNSSGVYVYNLIQVEDGSSTSCFRVKNDTVSIEVKTLPNATLEGDITLCQNDEFPELIFKGFGGEAPYTFKYNINGGEELTIHTDVNDNSSIISCPTNVSGTYKFNLLNVEEGGELNCVQQQTGSVTININPLPVANFYMDSVSKSILNPQFKFFNSSKNSEYFLWDFGDGETSSEENPDHFFDEESGEQIITLFVENSFNCKDTVSKEIKIRNDVLFYVPNSFTPNGDKLNDEFKPTLLHQKIEFDEYAFFIYNRWGEILFESHDLNKGWSGYLGGQDGLKCEQGNYIWKIISKEKTTDTRNIITGHVILLR